VFLRRGPGGEGEVVARTPVLWQIKVSHYNEKTRWALDHKGVPHRRRSPTPLIGTLPTAWVLSRGTTFPILRIDGRTIDLHKLKAAAFGEAIDRLAGVAVLVGGNQQRGRDLSEAIEHALRTKVGRTGRPHGAERCRGEHRDDRFRKIRAEPGNAITRPHTAPPHSRGGCRGAEAGSIGWLKKVEWPNRRQLFTATGVVIIAIAVVGAYLWVADLAFARFVKDVLLTL